MPGAAPGGWGMSESLVDLFKSIPDILKTIPSGQRVGALVLLIFLAIVFGVFSYGYVPSEQRLAVLTLIFFLVVLLAFLYSGALNLLSANAREIAILFIIRYGLIGTGVLCLGSISYSLITFRAEAHELTKSIINSNLSTTKDTNRTLRPILPPDGIEEISTKLLTLSRQPNPPPGIDDAKTQLNAGNPLPAIAILQEDARRQTDNLKRAAALRPAGLLAFYKDTQIAINIYQQLLELDPNSWEAWSQIAYLYERQGNHADAKAAAQKIIDIGNTTHDPKALGAGYAALGYIEASAGRADTAKEFLEKARGNFLAAGAKVEFAKATNNLAQVNFSQGDYETATRLYEEALSYDSAAKNQRGVASDYVGLAQVLTTLNQADKALDYLNKALVINQDIDDFHQQALTLAAIGTINLNAGNLDVAKMNFTSALKLEKSLGNLASQIFDTGVLAKIASLMNDFEGAESKYLEAIDMAKKGDSRFLEAVMQRGIGTLYSNQKKYPLAVAAFNRAIEIDHNLNQTKYQALDLKSLGWVFGQQDQKSEACSSWKQAQDLLRKITAETELESVQKAAADEIESLQKAAADMACHD
jgi:tetratricopeptide (TPR) repeat protein